MMSRRKRPIMMLPWKTTMKKMRMRIENTIQEIPQRSDKVFSLMHIM
jgi:hypothetical protein